MSYSNENKDIVLTWHGDHWCSSPENIHACGVTIAERSVQAHISQLAPSHVLLFGCHRREYDTRSGKTHVLSILLDVGLADGRESKKPQHTVGYALKDLQGNSL